VTTGGEPAPTVFVKIFYGGIELHNLTTYIMATVLIGGGSGLIGQRLSVLLTEAGHEVRHLSRRERPFSLFDTYRWDVKNGEIDPAALSGVTHVINLAGAGIADSRWTESRKKLIISSRTESTRLLKRAIREHQPPLKAYIAGTANGYYGDRGSEWLTEDSGPGKGFLSTSTQTWEAAVQEIPAELNLPILIIRTGIVLSTTGGALPKMLLPLQAFTSTYFGDGSQYYSWIHLDDICRIFMRGVTDDQFRGVYNGSAPEPVTNKQFAQALIDATEKNAVLLPAPAFALRLALGDMADTVLSSTRCSAQKLLDHGFEFEYADLVSALRDLLERQL
jgi:uncharacterized protein (TIGR01777 family)